MLTNKERCLVRFALYAFAVIVALIAAETCDAQEPSAYLWGTDHPGETGGCAVTNTDGYLTLECTYGDVSGDYWPGTREVMIYGYDLTGEDLPLASGEPIPAHVLATARGLVDYLRGRPQGFYAGFILSASVEVINETFTNGSDLR